MKQLQKYKENIEYGFNENGEYWKYNETGLMICKYTKFINVKEYSQTSGFYCSQAISWTYPHSFKDPSVITKGTFIPFGLGMLLDNDVGASSYIFNIAQTQSRVQDFKINLIAIGRFK